MPWRIDSWNPADGLAFATRLGSETDGETVFLRVPYLDPTPVRVSTAYRAARSGFQERFFDLEGEEIFFEDLDQIRELVRRTYISTDLGPEGDGLGVAPPPEVPDRPGTAEGNSRFEDAARIPISEILGSEPNAIREIAVGLDLPTLIRELALSFLFRSAATDKGLPDQQRLVNTVTHVLKAGLLGPAATPAARHERFYDLRTVVDANGQAWLGTVLEDWAPDIIQGVVDWTPNLENVHALSNAPPIVPTGLLWPEPLTRLRQTQLLGLCSIRFWAEASILDLGILVLTSALLGPASNPEDALRIVIDAIDSRPRAGQLPGPAEAALEQYIGDRLGESARAARRRRPEASL